MNPSFATFAAEPGQHFCQTQVALEAGRRGRSSQASLPPETCRSAQCAREKWSPQYPTYLDRIYMRATSKESPGPRRWLDNYHVCSMTMMAYHSSPIGQSRLYAVFAKRYRCRQLTTSLPTATSFSSAASSTFLQPFGLKATEVSTSVTRRT